MNFEFFVFDLDGTLLDAQGCVLTGVRELLTDLRRHARVTLATGRSLVSAWPYIEDFRIFEPVILYHGAVVFCPQKRKVLRELRVPGEAAVTALHVARRFPVSIQIYRSVYEASPYVEQITPAILDFVKKEGLKIRCVFSLEKLAQENPLKMLLIGDPPCLRELKATLVSLGLTVVQSEQNFLEVLPPGVSKGEALAWLCAQLGVSLEWVVAVGDQESDVSMIEIAGLGVAMAHAPIWVRARAKRVVKNPLELGDLFGTS